jgi:hypothetical protein
MRARCEITDGGERWLMCDVIRDMWMEERRAEARLAVHCVACCNLTTATDRQPVCVCE